MATTIFCKKGQKNSPNGTIFGKILVRRRPGFLLDRKKIEKSSKFFGHFGFFLEDTCLGQSGQNTGFPKEKSKKVRKSQTTSGFSSKILVWSDPMATLTTTLNEQKGKGMNNTS
jgi:hypothetical protein